MKCFLLDREKLLANETLFFCKQAAQKTYNTNIAREVLGVGDLSPSFWNHLYETIIEYYYRLFYPR